MSTDTLSIDDLELTPGVLDPLKAAGIHTVGEVAAMTDLELLEVKDFGKAKLGKLRKAVHDAKPQDQAAEPAPSFSEPRKNKPEQFATLKEARQAEALERIQESALHTQQKLREREQQLQNICDDLLLAGNTPDAMRTYWPEYRSPEERGE